MRKRMKKKKERMGRICKYKKEGRMGEGVEEEESHPVVKDEEEDEEGDEEVHIRKG